MKDKDAYIKELEAKVEAASRAEIELQKSEEKYQLLLDSIPDTSIRVFDSDLRFQYVGGGEDAKNGFDPSQMLGKTLQEAYPQEVVDIFEPVYQKALRGGETLFEMSYGPFVYSQRTVPVKDKSGKAWGAMQISVNITERKRAEQNQKILNEILSVLNQNAAFSELMNDIVAIIKEHSGFDAVGLRLKSGEDFPYFVQQGFSEDFLLRENTLLVRGAGGALCRDAQGKACLECTCGMVLKGASALSEKYLTPGGSYWTNNSLPILDIPADQDPRQNPRNRCIHDGYLSVALIPLRADNEIVGLLQLNDRKADRLTLETVQFFEGVGIVIGGTLIRRDMAHKLQQSEELHRVLFDNSSMALSTLEAPAWRFTNANPATLALFGALSEAEFIAHAPWEYSPERQPDGQLSSLKAKTQIEQAMRDGHCFFEWTHKRLSGEEFFATVTLMRMNVNGRQFLQANVCDVSVNKKNEKEKAQMLGQLFHQQKLVSIGTLSAGLAHEINNPLSIIKGFHDLNTSYLRKRELIDEKMQKYFDGQSVAIERIEKLVKGMLNFVGRDDESLETIDLHTVISDTVAMVNNFYSKQKVTIELKLHAPKSCVRATRSKSQQIFMNLLGNAKDAVQDSASKVIVVETRSDAGTFYVSVSDTGHGIDVEHLDRVFDPFFTTKDPGKGTGLGLTITHSLVDSFGWKIGVKSEKDRGTTFTVSAPSV